VVASVRRVGYGEGRDALVQAAIRVVAQQGLSGLSYRTLAAEAGMTHGSIRHHFASIGAVVAAALESTFDATSGVSPVPTEPAEVFSNLVEEVLKHPDISAFQFEVLLAARHSPELARVAERLYEAYRRRIRDDLAGLGVADEDGMVELVLAAVDGIVFQLVISDGREWERAQHQLAVLRRVLAAASRPE
jgi:AcrR family transcriptional regulator